MRDVAWQGCIDFTRFDPDYGPDARRLEWFMSGAEERRTAEYLAATIASHDRMAQRISADNPHRGALVKTLEKLRKGYVRSLVPWLDSGDDEPAVDVADMRAQWVKAFGGDPADPAIAAEIDRVAAWLNKAA
jgi:hypothetical protein